MPVLLLCAAAAVVALGVCVMGWLDANEDAEVERCRAEIERAIMEVEIERIIRESQRV